jgi:hypothetical protein
VVRVEETNITMIALSANILHANLISLIEGLAGPHTAY